MTTMTDMQVYVTKEGNRYFIHYIEGTCTDCGKPIGPLPAAEAYFWD